MTTKILLAMGLSYLVGSFPTAFVFGKVLKGIDIRHYGSGNVGATNAIRILGKGPGITVLILDILKGLLALTSVGDFLGLHAMFERILLGLAVVAGHNWSVFLQFKGGKGMATSLGVLLGLTIKFPSLGLVLLTCLVIWGAIFIISGYVSLASMASALALPVSALITGQPRSFQALSLIFCVFVMVRHRLNIQRLLSGNESRVSFRKKTSRA